MQTSVTLPPQTPGGGFGTRAPLPRPGAAGHGTRLPSLDGARGIAILLVLGDHLSSRKLIPVPLLHGLGHMGVYLFFSLSGFLLTVPFLQRGGPPLREPRTWGVYFLRRLLRIYPLYAVALCARHFTEPGFPWAAVRDHLLLRRGDSVFWTMEIETRYYLILPLLVVAIAWAWRRGWLARAVLAAAFWPCMISLFHAEHRWLSLDGHFLRPYFPVFLLGSAAGACFAFRPPRRRRDAARAMVWDAASALGLCGGGLILAPAVLAVLPPALAPGWQCRIALSGVFWAVFLLGHLYGAGRVRRVLEWAPLRWLGLASYSAYLWHQPVTTWCMRAAGPGLGTLPWPMACLPVGACVLAAASLSSRLIERPLARIRFPQGRPAACKIIAPVQILFRCG